MFVAASTECFPDLPLDTAMERLADLEYTRIEVGIRESGNQLKPSAVHADLEWAVQLCKATHRLTPVAYEAEIEGEGATYFEQFESICKLAKATKVVTVTVRALEVGTPFNAEVERLRELARIASLEGVVVGLRTEVGRMTQDPNTAAALCDNVPGLGITLDPSHYIIGPFSGCNYDGLFRFVTHVHLRDTSKRELQVRVGQGEVEYGRLISHLERLRYNRALSVYIKDLHLPDLDHMGEMRKIRLLLESML